MTKDDPKLKNILEQIKNFGFTFYGFDENGQPLVVGPNKQVIHINIAIQFVNQQVANSSSSAGPESMPDMPSMPQAPERNLETNVETSAESQKQQKQQQINVSSDNSVAVPQKAPTIKLERPKIIPYGAGFEPTSFNPESLESTMKFISDNTKSSKKSSNKWLAEQFKKFVQEIQNKDK